MLPGLSYTAGASFGSSEELITTATIKASGVNDDPDASNPVAIPHLLFPPLAKPNTSPTS